MSRNKIIHNIQDIEFTVIYSKRRTLGLSVLPDASVIVRVPYLTSSRTINRIVQEKAAWIIKHRDSYRNKEINRFNRSFRNNDIHLFRGNECVLKIQKSIRPFIRFTDGTIELGLDKPDDSQSVKKLLYKGYKTEAQLLFPRLLGNALIEFENYDFKPVGIIIRTMKRRWGSCSNKGIITLSTELMKLPDILIEYVIIHELCHLKHHNHGAEYYNLLSELFPGWKLMRKELRKYIIM